MIIAIVMISVALLLCGLHFYMLRRMEILTQSRKLPTPNPLRTLIELVVFILVYLGCAILASLPNLNGTSIATMTILGFFASLLTFNYQLYKTMGRKAAVVSVTVIYVIYIIGFFVQQ